MSAIAYKERTKSKHLRIYEILHKRMQLENDDYYYYLNLKKGFEGECRFDEYTEQIGMNCLVLNDLQLEMRRSSFQIDALLICSDKFLLYEIKNYEGVHQWGKDKFTKATGIALENPSMQVQKTKVRLELLLQELDCRMPVEAYVVFINPEFTLLSAPSDEGYILPSQIPGYFRNIRMSARPTAEQKRLAKALANLHEPNYPSKMPEYHYEQLRKGMPCPECGSLAETFKGHFQTCSNCGQRMNVKAIIRTSIEDFRILFPEEKITSGRMLDWCGSGDQDRIYRVLKADRSYIGKNRGRYYL